MYFVGLASVLGALRKNILFDVLKRSIEERGFALRHFPAKIDDPHVAGTSRQVHAVAPWPQHIGIWSAIRIEWQEQPCARECAGNIERAAFRVAHICDVKIFNKVPDTSEIQ